MRRKPEVRLSVRPLIISPTSRETMGFLTYLRAHGVVYRIASVAFAHTDAVSRFFLDMLHIKTSFQETDIAQFAEGRLSRFLRVLLLHGVLRIWHGRSGRGRAKLVNSRRAQVG